MYVAKKVKPARALRNKEGVYEKWLINLIVTKHVLKDMLVFVVKSAVLLSVRVLMCSAPTATSAPSLLMT
jgi:hypothetical protein